MPEYAQSHATNSLFVEGIFQDVLNRSLNASDEIYWENQVQTGQSRMGVAADIVQSVEAEQNLVDHYYRIFLGRPADGGALFSGVEFLAGDQGGQLPLVQTVLVSAEFLSKI